MSDEAPSSDERVFRDEQAMDCTPPLSATDFDRQLDELSVDAPPLPADFSRADIYLDHD